MKRPALFVLLALLSLGLPQLAAADATADKAQSIRQIMQLAGVDDLTQTYGKTMTEQIYQVLKNAQPNLPPEAMNVIREEVGKQLAADRDRLLGKVAAVFDRTFSAEELAELTRFYQTELGRKSVAIIPKILQENVEIGKAWGKEVGPALKARLEARFKQHPPAKAAPAR